MGFFFFLVANFVVFVRPGEAFTGLEGIQFYLITIGLSMIFGHRELYRLLDWQVIKSQPITICVMGVMLGVIVSHITNFYLGGILLGGVEFFKVVVYYIMLVALVTTPQRFRLLMQTSAMSAAIMISMSVLDYLDVIEMVKITHVVETHGADLFGNEQKITRMCGTGMFHDPNDISLIIVVMSTICFYYLLEPTERLSRNTAIMFISKMIWLAPLSVFFVGLLCTQSRGGLLAMGAAIVAWSTIKYGKLPALAAIFLGIIAIPIMLGRQGDINLNEGTAQQRIRLWSDGLVAITNHRVLFGIGEGRYDEVAELVAHNSYIHSFVELGFLGGTFFFGCFFFAAYGLWKIERDRLVIYNPELHRFKAYFAGILAGYCIGMCSLSRCYIPPTYLICGIATCYFNIIGLYIWPSGYIVQWDSNSIRKLVAGSFCCLLGSFVMVKIFARF